MMGSPLLSPSTTIFAFWLFDSSWATSIALHLRSSALMPLATIVWKSAIPGPPRACARPLAARVQHEAHALGLLLGLELLLDGGGEQRGQLHGAEQHLLGLDPSRGERGLRVLEHVLRDELPGSGVEELRLVLGVMSKRSQHQDPSVAVDPFLDRQPELLLPDHSSAQVVRATDRPTRVSDGAGGPQAGHRIMT